MQMSKPVAQNAAGFFVQKQKKTPKRLGIQELD